MFIIRPPVIDSESLAGYIHRLLKENYSTLSALKHQYGFDFNEIRCGIFSEKEIQMSSELVGLPTSTIVSMTVNQWVATRSIADRDILRSKVKFCPKCIEHCPHHKLNWGLLNELKSQ